MRLGFQAMATIAAAVSRRPQSVAMSTCAPGSTTIQRHFDRLLSDKREVLILDGGTGEELFRRGVPDDRKIWSATALVNKQYQPVLRDVHRSFIDAGSDAVTTNSYGVTPGVGFSREDVARYVAEAGRIARESVGGGGSCAADPKTPPSSAIVFGSLGPLVESYRPDMVMEHAAGVDMYGIMVRALSPHVDGYLAETMSSFEEASQAVEAVGKLPPEAKQGMMVSYTLKDDGAIRSGETAAKGVRMISDFAQKFDVHLMGVLFNCAEPESITKAFQQIHSNEELRNLLEARGTLLGAYANRLTAVASDWTLEGSEEPQAMRKDLSPEDYFDRFVKVWVNDLGVQMVGGCCGITPEHISYIRSHLSTQEGD